MASIARRVTCRDRGVLLAFRADTGTAESFRTPSNLRRTGSFCAGPAVPPGAVHAHLVRSGSAMASATSFTPHSCSGTDAMRTPLGLGCIGHRHVGAMGAIRTMAAKKSTTKSSQRRRRKGKHGGKHDNDATSRTGNGTSRRRQTAKDRLRGVMKSYKAMIDGHDDDGADPGEATASHEDGGQRVPPAYLAATASPHAWIAASAADATGVDRGQLFAHGGGPPGSFRSARFEYCSPKAFGHELPEFSIPEVAFLGRSNVGKSSLINALTGTRDLARVSKRPGRTQQVNYFALLGGGGGGGGGKKSPRPAAARRAGGASSSPSSSAAAGAPFRPSDATGFLVDLPGFGYAAAPDDAVDEWQRTTMDFLLQRRDHGTMARVYLLVDGRHGATTLDLAVMEWFDEAEVPYTIVLTKTDASASRAGVIKHVNELCLRFTGRLHGGGGVFQGPVVHLTSVKTGDGVEDLMWAIDGDFVGYCEGAEGAIVDSGKPRW